MGADKALVDFEERPLVVHVVERLSAWSDDVFVVSKAKSQLQALRLRVVADDDPAQTPLAGILAALRAARHPLVFVCAVDMPFVSADVVAMLASRADGVDAVVPVRDGRLEPLHAVWAKDALDAIAAELDAGERAVHKVLERLTIVTIDDNVWRSADRDGRSFTNLNTPDELDAARERIG